MGAGDRAVRTRVILAQVLLVGSWLDVTWGASGARPVSSSGPSVATGTYDAGESLRIGQRRISLRRSRQKVAVIRPSATGIAIAAAPDGPGGQIETTGRLYRFERQIGPSGAAGRTGRPALTVLQTRTFTSAEEQTASMRQLQKQTAAAEVVPVYVHPDSGLEMIPTGKVVVKLRMPDDPAGLAALNRRLGTQIDHRIRGTTDQYVLVAPHATARELFDLCAVLEREPAVEWAEPDFISQVVRHSYRPNDPLFGPDQWYLQDINVHQAWDIVRGSAQVTIAIIDDGVDLRHEDLQDALPSNVAEVPNNRLDDDRNGWKDDTCGWNFHDDNSNASPGPYNSHGTQVAGVAAATGNNGKGIAGCAFGCKLMPLKVLAGDPREETEDAANEAIAEALYYAAGQALNGKDRWRGADVISISLGFSETNLVNAALQFAVQKGRNGKGCPVFCASGNDGSGWAGYRIYGIDAGTHHFRWELVRDGSGSDGANTVWLDSILWPGGTPEWLNWGLPEDWKTGGTAPWTLVPNNAEGNHAMTGWRGRKGRALCPGPLDHWGQSYLDVRKKVDDGHLDFSVWSSLQESSPCLVGDSFFLLPDLWPFSTLGSPQHRRTQFICRRDELGWNPYEPSPARALKFVEFQIVDAPSQRLDELTIRIKQIEAGRDSYDRAEWDEAGWTTVFHGTNVPLNTGTLFDLPGGGGRANLIRFYFSRGFTYDPRYNLAVDISMTQTQSGAWGGWCLTALTDETRAIVGEEFGTLGPDQPAHWHGSAGNAELSNWVPLMWIGSGDELRLFIDGMLVAKASGVAQAKSGISYPASNTYAISVGASTDFGLRSDYSQYGPNLDFLAPSSGGERAICSTDRMGRNGDDPNNYSHTFGGTSAATPLASGVAALMLSRNPQLTADQIRTILRQTCTKIGDEPYPAGRNDYYGYGRIDAKAAVAAAGQ